MIYSVEKSAFALAIACALCATTLHGENIKFSKATVTSKQKLDVSKMETEQLSPEVVIGHFKFNLENVITKSIHVIGMVGNKQIEIDNKTGNATVDLEAYIEEQLKSIQRERENAQISYARGKDGYYYACAFVKNFGARYTQKSKKCFGKYTKTKVRFLTQEDLLSDKQTQKRKTSDEMNEKENLQAKLLPFEDRFTLKQYQTAFNIVGEKRANVDYADFESEKPKRNVANPNSYRYRMGLPCRRRLANQDQIDRFARESVRCQA